MCDCNKKYVASCGKNIPFCNPISNKIANLVKVAKVVEEKYSGMIPECSDKDGKNYLILVTQNYHFVPTIMKLKT